MAPVAELVRDLARPGAYPHAPATVTWAQTHISLLFFAGDRVYKVKKPVRFDFLDYSTLDRRRRFCEEEVRLNRRLAPDTYLGVVPIVRGAEGALRAGGPGEAVEYAVEMRRLPADRMMDRLLARGEIDNGILRRIADLLARFHADAATGPGVDDHGTPEAVRRVLEDNLRAARPHLPPALLGKLERDLLGFAAAHEGLLRERVREGRIRDGHGDLHAGNLCMTAQGIVVYDCIEFEPRFRCGDVANDLAFLAMDLDLRGFRAFSDYLVRAYARRTRDPRLPLLLPFYKSARALVRGIVGALRAADANVAPAEREAARLESLRYFHLALSYGLPASLLLTCGLPATGKSTVARALAAPFEAVLLRSDAVRKRLLGIPRTRRWEGGYAEGPYAPARTDETYEALLGEAGARLDAGRTVVVDATFRRRAWRDRFREAARARGAPCVLVHVTCPEEVVARRMRDRPRDAGEVSDATLEVYRRARDELEPPDEVPPEERADVAGDRPPEEAVTAALERLAGARMLRPGTAAAIFLPHPKGSPPMVLCANDIMSTDVITVTPTTPVSEFARLCTDDNISGVPVVRPDGAVVGIVSKTDIVQHLLDQGRRFGSKKEAPAWDMEGHEVQDIMHADVFTVAPDTPVSEIAERMAEDRIHRVLVMKGDKLVGIVTSIDILAYYPKDD